MSGFAFDPCDKCEQMMQPYLDRVLTDAEVREAELHLEGCEYCRKRYTFEEEFRTLLAAGGFGLTRVVPVTPAFSVIEARPA